MCTRYNDVMNEIKSYYDINFLPIKHAVEEGRNTMKQLSKEEKVKFENSVILADLLYKMCKVQLVKQAETEEGINSVNEEDIESIFSAAKTVKNRLNIA